MGGENPMSTKTDTEVIIAGKVFTLSGYESEEYLQRVASYINNKIAEYNKVDSFKRQSLDTQNVLLQLNIADDYFKAKEQAENLEEAVREKEKEIYELQHDLISAKIRVESSEKMAAELEKENKELLLNKSKLEASLEDALLGKVKGQAAIQQELEPQDKGQAFIQPEPEALDKGQDTNRQKNEKKNGKERVTQKK